MPEDDMDSGVESCNLSGHQSPNPTTSGRADDDSEQRLIEIGSVSQLHEEQNDDINVDSNVHPSNSAPVANSGDDGDDEDEDIDETLAERLYGLTEMFPQFLRHGVHSLTCNTIQGAKWFYSISRTTMWIIFSSSTILVAPVLFELERSQMQKQMQRQMLLGHGVGMSGSAPPGMMGMPPPPPPSPPQRTS
ncbi:hypothetical protein B4U79_07774 [Dinothrombium tinctorium]|uniref:Mitochondrial import receptor subunit TOM22 homolog n=1 Tax=Dinothrombium tinctorium TaxID=1965070 RepID=A0A3S3PK56_9ACAR|nr:hypothetical protein B4U79_12811 [Dinothrombium tinctorium]RWS14190.1 hypothetical protein B4U79_00803 [Dinothrombium tinctorium]RWS14712.1 hypothetical protein B4U79_07774 [Dinothrombium tinctorium]